MADGRPALHFASVGAGRVAYLVGGSGPRVLHVGNWLTNNDAFDSVPALRAYFDGVWAFAECVFLDMTGSGGSDAVEHSVFGGPGEWIAAVEAVLDDLGWPSVTLIGWDAATHPVLAVAATRPSRVERVVLLQPFVRSIRAADFPFGGSEEEAHEAADFMASLHGTAEYLRALTPSGAADTASCEGWARWQRAANTAAVARQLQRFVLSLDSRHYLDDVDAPALVVETSYPFGGGQGAYVTRRLAHARFVKLPSQDFFPIATHDLELLLGEIGEFVTGTRPQFGTRALAAIVFTDVVGSTTEAVGLGDRRWRDRLARHDDAAADHVRRHGGRLVKSTGDGVLATFPAASSAVSFAIELRDALRRDGIRIRSGVHVGDVEIVGGDVAGLSVHIAARVAALAGAGDVLATRSTREALGGVPFAYTDRGEHELKGVPGFWLLTAVDPPTA